MPCPVTHDANQISTQRLLQQYLPTGDTNVWSLEDACISAKRIARYGISADASCWRYTIEAPELGWTVEVRAVWRPHRRGSRASGAR